MTSRRKQTQDEGYHPLPLRRGYSTPEGLLQSQGKNLLHKPAQEEERETTVQFFADKRNESFSGFSSLDSSPTHSYRFRSYSLSVKDRFQVF